MNVDLIRAYRTQNFNSEYKDQTKLSAEKITNFFQLHLKNKIEEKKSVHSRFKQYGEPLLFSVPAATWLLGNYLGKENLKKIGKYGIHTNLFYLVSKNCFGIYKAYESGRMQEYSPGEIIKDFCCNNTPVTILKNAIGGTLSFINNHPSLFIAIVHGTTDTSCNFKKKSSSEEEMADKEKDKKGEKKKPESHPLALIGLCLIPPIFLVTAIWACIENQPFFADCKALQKELENEREEEYFLLKEHIKNIQDFNHYVRREDRNDEDKTKITDYNKACEALIYNQTLIEKKSYLLGDLFDEEVLMVKKRNPYKTTSGDFQEEGSFCVE